MGKIFLYIEKIANAMSLHSIEFNIDDTVRKIEEICGNDARVTEYEVMSFVKGEMVSEKFWGALHSQFDYALTCYSINVKRGISGDDDYGAVVLSSYFLCLASRYDFGDWDGTFEKILTTIRLFTQIDTDLRARHLIIILESRFLEKGDAAL